MQNALLRAWRRRSDCRTPEAPLPWLLQITRNEALREKPLREQETPTDIPFEPGEADPLQPVPLRVDVQRALADLPRDDRRLLGLRYEADLTQPRVAEVMGLPEGTVKVRLYRLRRRLLNDLEGD